MAANGALVQLAERSDIHKSCKSLETLLNVLNDYCEAAGAVVVLQKKLAKALREAAGLKVTGEIAANAMSASAVIFEVSSDIDSKYAKITDKEYDSISTEVKKWFKKLAKEEKLHDVKMANANARIRQAGDIYEKKSKKNARDATEDHARYINLISSLGPEISQEKYNHALNVTQRHTSTTYSTAACLSRIADASWLRVCEGVRRFSPTVGQLGEWRALCEGGWIGPLPQDLPDPDEDQQLQSGRAVIAEICHKDNTSESPTAAPRNIVPQGTPQSIERTQPLQVHPSPIGTGKPPDHPSPNRSSPAFPPPSQLHQSNLSLHQGLSLSIAPSSFEPPRPFVDANTGSVRSLSAFPSPPTHFPLPPPRRQQSSRSQSSQASSSHVNTPAMGRVTESPLPDDTEDPGDGPPSIQPQQDISPPSNPALPSPGHSPKENDPVIDTPDASHNRPGYDTPLNASISNQRSTETPPRPTIPDSQPRPRPNVGDQINNEREFGVGHASKGRTANTMKSQGIERSDTSGSSGSIVAAMRNHYSSTPGPSSPTLKDVLRLPLSVNDLAMRYQPTEGLSSPRNRTPSTSMSRQLPPSPGEIRYKDRRTSDSHRYQPPTPNTESIPDDGAIHRQRQRVDDLAQLELKEKELELQERERDIQMRARELERDRARLAGVREGNEYTNLEDSYRRPVDSPSQLQMRPRERRTSFRQQPPPPIASPLPDNVSQPQTQYPYSTNHLVPPLNSIPIRPSPSFDSKSSRHSQSQYSPTSSRPSIHYQNDLPHAPYCGCETCSVSKYKATQVSPQPHDLRPPAQPITLRPVEKSKPGWIRRLSMPVGNAFNLDSSKHSKGIANIASTGGDQGRGGIFSLDGGKNISTTTLRTGIQEDGRRSYDAAAVSNRSMTNLVGGRR